MLFGIFLREEGTHIGNIKLGPIDNQHLTSELGFIIGESSAWGLGFASEAISCISQWAFSDLHLSKLTAGCYEQNIGSKRALEKSGFVQEAVLKKQVVDFSGNRQDILKFARHAL
jgi:RimJ/RimL family protein N-acetyltransferase